MKKVLSTLIIVALLLGMLSAIIIPASAATSGTTGDCTWSLDGTELTISGSGAMENYTSSSAPWGKSVTKVTIGNGVTTIGEDAFYGCDSLTSVTIPDSVTSIGNNAFSFCGGLTSVTIPDSVTEIGFSAFSFCDSLTSITIPDGVTSIGESAFSNCASLTNITIPDGITSISSYAFSGCENLTSINIPDGVMSIGECAFWWCDNLTSITIPNSVTSIGKQAFYCCLSITSITIPNSVTNIGACAFYRCESLASITIPNSVTSIGYSAFWSCYGLTSIVVDADNANYCSENGVLFSKDKTSLICYPAGKSGAYVIPDSVTTIGAEAFEYCFALTSVTIPGSVTSIGDYAFWSCSGLTSVTIPESVTSIGECAFIDCSGLRDVWYTGSADDRKGIAIGEYNEPLIDATWHYKNPFTDIKESDFYYTPVLWAVENGITSGTSATTFAPNDACTRGQIVAFLWRAAGSPAPKRSNNPFKDVGSNQYYYQAVLWAVENGITSGTSATTFGPNDACTRGQIVSFLCRAAGSPAPKGNNNPFKDVGSNQYYYKAVLWAVENGITAGTSATTFSPNAACTRGQIVTFLFRSKN